MDLHERLLNLGRTSKLDKASMLDTLSQMLDISMYDIRQRGLREGAYKAHFVSVNDTWTAVAHVLDKEGKGFIKPQAFKEYVARQPDLAYVWNP